MGQQAHVQLALWEWSKLCKCTYRRAWPPGDLHTQPGTPAAGVILSKVHMTKVTPSLDTAGSASCKVSADLSPPPRKPFMKPVLLLTDFLNVTLLPSIFPLWISFLFIYPCPAHLSRSFHQVLAQPKSFHIALIHTIHLPILYILTVIVSHTTHGQCDCLLAFFCTIPQFWYYCLTVHILTLRPDCNAVQTTKVYLLAVTQY